MPYPTGQFANRLQLLDGHLADLKRACDRHAAEMSRGPVPAGRVWDAYARLTDAIESIGDAKGIVTSVPNFETYIKQQKESDPGQIVDVLASIAAACADAQAAIVATVPVDADGFILAWKWTERGPVPRSFTTKETAPVAAALLTVSALIE